jgi:hypothetical protein
MTKEDLTDTERLKHIVHNYIKVMRHLIVDIEKYCDMAERDLDVLNNKMTKEEEEE